MEPNLDASALATYHDARRSDLFVALSRPGVGLVTVELYEGPETGFAEHLQDTPWDVAVPEGARPFIATAGHRAGVLRMAWAGWREGLEIHAISIFHEAPIVARLEPGDRLVDPPILTGDKRLLQLVLRGRSLLCHAFSGEEDQATGYALTHVVDLPGAAEHAVAAPILGHRTDGVLLGWAQPEGEGTCRAGCAILENGRVDLLLSDPVAGAPFGTPGVHCAPGAPPEVGFVAAQGNGRSALVTCAFDFDRRASRAATLALPEVASGLRAAATFYLKDPSHAVPLSCLLTAEQSLVLHGPEVLREVRRGVPDGYAFPIVTSHSVLYEAHPDPIHTVRLEPL
jgi:hypothetical protein